MKKPIGTITITRKIFCSIFNNLIQQNKHDEKCTKAFNKILPNDYTSGYDNYRVTNQLLDILKDAFNDNHKESWIDYFICDLDYGKKYKAGCATYKNGENIDLSSVENMYEFLVKINLEDEK